MKKAFFIFCLPLLTIACNNGGSSAGSGMSDSTKMSDKKQDSSAAKLDYPYTVNHAAEYWVPGDPKNAYNALKSLKAYETGNPVEAAGYFGDSVLLLFDGLRSHISNDSLKKIFTQWRGDQTSFVVRMDDFVSLKGNDGKEEWVTLWYKQIITNKNGKTDSANVVDDLKVENGKFVVLDEKQQHSPAPKK